jgi:uncharacterized protein YqeY
MVATIQQDLIAAMKAKDDVRVGTLRLLLSSLKNKQIELGHELNQDEAMAVVQKEVKQRKDSISQYQAAGRSDLAAAEAAELEVLQAYMPAQLSEVEIATEVEKAIVATNASSATEMGNVMGALTHLKGKADMSLVSSIVKQKLVG